jgi:hypothetical protein
MAMPVQPLLLGLLLAMGTPAVRAQDTDTLPKAAPVDSLQSASPEIKRVARWIVDSGDNIGLPFLLVDKVNAQVFVFTPAGRLQGEAPALLGMARGDRLLVSNDTQVAAVPPQARITPAGRFVSSLARDEHGAELLVIDYDASISLHPVIKGTPEERRAERLGSATAQDNRISHGCINVPTDFYASVVSPTFQRTRGVVYILPESGSATQLFGIHSVGDDLPAVQRDATALAAPMAPRGQDSAAR